MAEPPECPRQKRQRVQPLGERTVGRRSQQSHGDAQQNGADDHHRQILDEAPREAARPLDPPDEVEARLDLLDGRNHGVYEEHESDRTQYVAAHVRHELHDVFGQAIGRASHGPQELVQQVAQVGACAESLQDRDAEHQQRHQRQQRGVGETHRADGDLARKPVADEGRGVAQQPQYRAPRRRHAAGSLEQSLLEPFLPLEHSAAPQAVNSLSASR